MNHFLTCAYFSNGLVKNYQLVIEGLNVWIDEAWLVESIISKHQLLQAAAVSHRTTATVQAPSSREPNGRCIARWHVQTVHQMWKQWKSIPLEISTTEWENTWSLEIFLKGCFLRDQFPCKPSFCMENLHQNILDPRNCPQLSPKRSQPKTRCLSRWWFLSRWFFP